MVFEFYSYRDFLKEVLLQRKKQNPSYSLRALAVALGFSSSQLSEAINGKANFSVSSLKKISKKLKLSTTETDYLCTLGEYESSKEPEQREACLNKLRRLNQSRTVFTDLTIDIFKQVADWRHSAILELVYLKGFNFNVENVAGILHLERAEAELAIDRLVRLELLQKNESGKYERTDDALQIQLPEQNSAMRSFYREMFGKASEALEEQSPSVRWSGYETIPIAEEAMPEIREACNRFFDEVLTISNRFENKTQVYMEKI